MSTPTQAPPRKILHNRFLSSPAAVDVSSTGQKYIYGRAFWLAYLANAVTMVAVALLFRYADFVLFLGGSEFHLGWIVGVGMVGSLFTRLAIGAWLDRYGARPLWICSLLLFALTCIAHLAVGSYQCPAIYVLRILYCCALAGINGASMTFISTCGPTRRMAELVGMLGTAGFLGMVVGTLLGDVLLGMLEKDRTEIVVMFVSAAVLGLLALPFAWNATKGEPHKASLAPKRACGSSGEKGKISWKAFFHPRTSPLFSPLAALGLLRRYLPGPVLLVAVAMGMALGLPGVFLRTFSENLGIPRLSLFFLVYALAAIITRVLTRRWAEWFGPRKVILLGLSGLALSLLLFLPVKSEWMLILPAIGFGCSHAVLFPSVVAAGSVVFPLEHRGLATVLILAMWDLGQLLGAPLAGGMVRIAGIINWPAYPLMFSVFAVLLAAVAVWYAIRSSPGKKTVDFSVESGSNISRASGPKVTGRMVCTPSANCGGKN